LVIAADVAVLLGYVGFFLVLRENSYASRVVEVDEQQKVIATGPYAVVRHPMYAAISVLWTFTPLALGSYWAVIGGVLIVPILVARILNEEQVLRRDLNGYADYMQKTRFRLLPGVW
jgi:protein-S-isoprenylcysteine O-methyltransferase Ste14